MKTSLCAGLLLLAALCNAQAATPPQVETCTACHGAQGEGNALVGAPRLAGQQAEYLLVQLRDFKAGRRGYDANDRHGAQMRAVVASLDDSAFASLATYYSGLAFTSPGASSAADVTQGRELYQGTCASCHGPQAQGFAHLKTPRLNILDGAYLHRQLEHYAQGTRGSEEHAGTLGIWMRGISLQVRQDSERQALVDYITRLGASPASAIGH
ncbi:MULTISPECIES: c-type cytochrome [Pseudomonas]|uniref:C-type cytochrome n=1 Tax=Pseudomonas sessilinigenes TaxID=658629 RepID=A0ABX8MFD1_9PSED|nr:MULTISPECIES: c-type cytochrome [Pseudomonas]AZC24717.1 Cytochrome c4 [Pseudomonas sessilinigenes]QIH08168.1 c-type cytochrome [Pseudomonas sp. BIOMIG1BAC]QXH37773.1 c-type cytochrome [Pseudomonas sessilinigenes]